VIGRILIPAAAGISFGILQSVFLSKIMPSGIVPDIAMIILIASAWKYGSLAGEITGFLIGISFDAMGLAPLGFHAFLFTFTGYLFGRMKGSVSPGSFILPIIGTSVATLLKYSGSFFLSMIFGLNSGVLRYFSLNTVWELAANILLAPLVFLTVSYSARIFEGKRGGFN